MIPFSILDLVPVTEGSDARTAFANTIDLACLGERLGYRRYWLAEHHNMPGIASAATAVLIGRVAGRTSTIRVGSGGIMLPNHAPLQVARGVEAFIERHRPDELMLTANVFDHTARMRSFELAADVLRAMN